MPGSVLYLHCFTLTALHSVPNSQTHLNWLLMIVKYLSIAWSGHQQAQLMISSKKQGQQGHFPTY